MPQAPYTLAQAEDDIAELRGQIEYLMELGSGLNFGVPGVAGANVFTTSVTAASLTNISTATYPGGNALVNSVYELDTWGYGAQGSTRQTLQFGVSLGGVAMTSVIFGTTAFEAVNAAFRWNALIRVICQTTGMTGTWTSFIRATISDFNNGTNAAITPSNNDFASATSCESSTVATVDTTVNQNFALQAAWGATAGGPSLTATTSLYRRAA